MRLPTLPPFQAPLPSSFSPSQGRGETRRTSPASPRQRTSRWGREGSGIGTAGWVGGCSERRVCAVRKIFRENMHRFLSFLDQGVDQGSASIHVRSASDGPPSFRGWLSGHVFVSRSSALVGVEQSSLSASTTRPPPSTATLVSSF